MDQLVDVAQAQELPLSDQGAASAPGPRAPDHPPASPRPWCCWRERTRSAVVPGGPGVAGHPGRWRCRGTGARAGSGAGRSRCGTWPGRSADSPTGSAQIGGKLARADLIEPRGIEGSLETLGIVRLHRLEMAMPRPASSSSSAWRYSPLSSSERSSRCSLIRCWPDGQRPAHGGPGLQHQQGQADQQVPGDVVPVGIMTLVRNQDRRHGLHVGDPQVPIAQVAEAVEAAGPPMLLQRIEAEDPLPEQPVPVSRGQVVVLPLMSSTMAEPCLIPKLVQQVRYHEADAADVDEDGRYRWPRQGRDADRR